MKKRTQAPSASMIGSSDTSRHVQSPSQPQMQAATRPLSSGMQSRAVPLSKGGSKRITSQAGVQNLNTEFWSVEETARLRRTPFSGKRKMELLLLVIFSIALILALGKLLKTPSGKVLAQEAKDMFVSWRETVPSVEIDWSIPPVYPNSLRDPMQLNPVAQSVAAAAVRMPEVRGIIHSENKRFAVVGTHIVAEGENLSGITVVKIDRDCVEFERDGKRWTQQVKGDGRKPEEK
jgi:hypothetical protein